MGQNKYHSCFENKSYFSKLVERVKINEKHPERFYLYRLIEVYTPKIALVFFGLETKTYLGYQFPFQRLHLSDNESK